MVSTQQNRSVDKRRIIEFVHDSQLHLDKAIASYQCVEMIDPAVFKNQDWHVLQQAWGDFCSDWNANWKGAMEVLFEIRPIILESAGLYGSQLHARLQIIDHLRKQLPFLEIGGVLNTKPESTDFYRRMMKKYLLAMRSLLSGIIIVSGVGLGLLGMVDTLLAFID